MLAEPYEESTERYAYSSITNAIRLARSNLDYLRQQQREMDWREEMYMRHWIEYYKKYALGVAVLIMFFIGAPLGSIIRKAV